MTFNTQKPTNKTKQNISPNAKRWEAVENEKPGGGMMISISVPDNYKRLELQLLFLHLEDLMGEVSHH